MCKLEGVLSVQGAGRTDPSDLGLGAEKREDTVCQDLQSSDLDS